MASLQTINASDNPNEGRIKINSNFTCINQDFQNAVAGAASGSTAVLAGSNITVASGTTLGIPYYTVSLATGITSINSFESVALTGTTIYSGSTDLSDIFLTNADIDPTRVQPGSNTSTGGTALNPTVNVVDSPSFNNITFSGNADGGNIISTNISGTTMFSGTTDIGDMVDTKANLSGATFTGAVSTSSSLSADTLTITTTSEAPLKLPILPLSFTSSTSGDVWIGADSPSGSVFLNVVISGTTKSVELNG